MRRTNAAIDEYAAGPGNSFADQTVKRQQTTVL